MKISTRLWLPTVGMGILVAVVSVVVASLTQSRVQREEEVLSAREQRLVHVVRWQSETSANIVRMVEALNSENPALVSSLKPNIDAATQNINAIQNSVESSTSDPEEKAALAAVSKARQLYIAARNAAMQLHESGQMEQARARLDNEVKPAAKAYQVTQQEFLVLQLTQGKALRVLMSKDRKATVWAVVVLMTLIVGLMVIGTVSQVRTICHPLDELADIARRVGEGDLEVDIPSGRQDELGRVQESLAGMRDALRGIVGQVREASESIQVASAGMATGNADLSQRTEQTASHLQQTASSLQELTVSVRQSAEAASQANQLASSASSVAQRGGEVVAQVVSTMDDINQASKRIADIIGTIDGIAFQTNILALNAAVEAARAGEQGRGFAVVASEVHSLAQRSAQAAREIKTLIGSSVDKVESGARLVQNAGSTMGEIVASVQRVSDIIGEITAASTEQSSGIGQVNGAVNSLDQMTQQNATQVQESATAAESLRMQAQLLGNMVQVFRMSGRTAPKTDARLAQSS